MRLLIVIVNYKSADLVLQNLRALEPEVRSIGDCRVSLTDCLSPDDSVAVINAGLDAQGYRTWVDFRPLPRNGGFSYGNNEGIRPYFRALGSSPRSGAPVPPADGLAGDSDTPQYVLLLNPDTYVRPGALATMLDHMDSHPDVGIAGARLEYPDGTPQRSAFRFPTIASELEGGLQLGLVSRLLSDKIVAPPVPDETVPTDWVCGAGMMIRREALERTGLLDEDYFMYFEELDYCLRAHRAGWRCEYVPAARVVHLVGKSSGLVFGDAERPRLPAYWFESRRRYFVKNHGWAYAAVADLVHATAFVLWRLRRPLTGRPDTDPERFLGDFLRHSVLLRRSS